MAGNALGYILGGLELVVGAVLTFTGIGAGVGIPLMVAGAATIAGTALAPSPPRTKELRDSPTYGIDKFDNPRGPDALVPILYGEHRVKPAVIQESVTTLAQGQEYGVGTQTLQRFRWLGVVCEGEVESLEELEINDRKVLSERRTGVLLGKGNGTKTQFQFPHAGVYLGDDERPEVDVYVDGVQKAFVKYSASQEFVVPAPPPPQTDPLTGEKLPIPALKFDLKRDSRSERILEASVTMRIRGTGYPEQTQPRRVKPYRWSAQKVTGRKVRVKFQTRPPTGFTVKLTYEYLAADGLALVQAPATGETKVVFGAAVANGKKVTASYRTTPFRGLRIRWRPGTIDQSPIEGFTDEENSRNVANPALAKDTPASHSTQAREVDDLRFTIVAPQGFIEFKDDGTGTHSVSAWVRIQYKPQGASNWTTLPSGAKGDQFVLQAEKSSTVRWEIGIRDTLEALAVAGNTNAIDQLEAFERGPYEAQVTRLTAQATNTTYVRDDLELAYVTEVLREGLTYPGTCLLAISAIPTEWLSQGSLRVTCLARRAKLFDPREAGGDRDIGSPFNPALAIRDLVTSSEGVAAERFGGGFFFTGSDFFAGDDPATLNGLAAFADWCDEYVHRPGDDATRAASATNGERRCRLSVVLDTPSSLMETVGDLAFLGYAFATLQGATWRFPLDKPGDAVFTFVDDVDPPNQNASNFTLKLDEWGRTPSAIQGSFWNEVLDYERDELLYPVEGLAEGSPTNVTEVDLRGVTRETEAARLLRHLAEQAREMSYPCTWDAHPGVQHVEAGDIVTVRTRVPYSTGANATELRVRVLAGLIGRDESGKLTVRYSGRVMASKSYTMTQAAVPSTSSAAAKLAKIQEVQAQRKTLRNLKATVK